MSGALSGPIFIAGAGAQAPGAPDSIPSDELRTDVEHIAQLFYDKQFEAVVREAGPLLARHGLTPTSVSILLYEAESRLRLGARDEAIRTYERALPVISTLDNVQQRRFAWIFFRLAMLAREKRQLDQAVAKAEAGFGSSLRTFARRSFSASSSTNAVSVRVRSRTSRTWRPHPCQRTRSARCSG